MTFPLVLSSLRGCIYAWFGILKCMSHFTEVNFAWVKLGQVRKIDVAEEECRRYCTIRVKGVDEN